MRGNLLRSIVGALASQAVQAVPLPPVSHVALPGTTLAAEPNLAGTIVQDVVTPFHYLQEVSVEDQSDFFPVEGTVQSRVVKSTDGSFDFHWRVNVNQGAVSRFLLTDASPLTHNANWLADGLGSQAPTFASRALGTIQFRFVDIIPDQGENGGLFAPRDSYFFFLDTDAPAYNKSGQYVLDSSLDFSGSMTVEIRGRSDSFATFAPIPEPQTYALMLTGLGAVGLALRRRNKR